MTICSVLFCWRKSTEKPCEKLADCPLKWTALCFSAVQLGWKAPLIRMPLSGSQAVGGSHHHCSNSPADILGDGSTEWLKISTTWNTSVGIAICLTDTSWEIRPSILYCSSPAANPCGAGAGENRWKNQLQFKEFICDWADGLLLGLLL